MFIVLWLTYFLHFVFPFQFSILQSHLQQSHVPIQVTLCDVVVTMDATTNIIGPLIF